ncbi:BTAD domain-containing putative transcriptional regulator [Planotetraspora thailandica]|uniref:AfsR/SARP family transcriptional regulator n=1 Tax=Planotetraspora thailandica TaxID=487172 RepID=UPI00195279AF|nr:BTAD domain-containing putative transcriptional regulator [Planotetraspora thailandica]
MTASGQASPEPVRFTVLGPVRAWRGETELDAGPPQQRAMLALLLVHAGRPVTLGEVVDVLWGEDPPASAVNVVHRYVGMLRRLLEPGLAVREEGRWLIRGAGGWRLEAGPDQVDLLRFRRMTEDARREGSLDLLTDALALWRGPAAAGIPAEVRAHPVFTALDRELLESVKESADLALRKGAAERVLTALREAATRHPLDEPLQARLVLALAAAGRQAEALDAWQSVRTRLADELGIDPGPELRAAQEQVLRGQAVHTAGPAGRTTREAHQPAARPTQLPPDLAAFAGRRADLAKVLTLLPDDGRTPETVVISAIGGMGGIGKSTLAVHWAHQVARHFPDGQLYVNLRGFDPTGSVLDTGEALRGFVEALGVPPHRIPAGLEAQSALYRSLLADRRVLVVLDNARDAEHVRPLLPGSPGCLVVITSRDRMSGLVTTEGAHPLVLDPLSPEEAREALVRRLGEDRVASAPQAVDEIIARCAGLPLALAVVAARAATHPGFPLAAIAEELADTDGSLDAFADPDPASDVRTVFSWSYRALSADAARLFRLLALHPGPDIGAPAAAGVVGLPVRRTRLLLAELTAARLLTEHAPGRYTCHDLLRAYAGELALAHDSEAERHAASQRVLDHYLRTAHAAGQLFSPYWSVTTLPPAPAGVVAEDFDDDRQALAWFNREHSVLLAVVDQAVRGGSDTYAWQLAWTLERFFDRQGHWHDFLAMQRAGLAAAVRAGERTAQAHIRRGLARASARLGRYDDANVHVRQALDLFTELGDRSGLAHAHRSHGWILDRQGRHAEALDAAGKALELYRATGNRPAEGSALHALGWTHALLGEHEQAAAYFEEALAATDRGNRYGVGGALDSLGYALHHLGDHRRAVASYDDALRLYREVGDRYQEAGTLGRLGDTYVAIGDQPMATTVWRQALAILDGVDPPAADEVRDKLRDLEQAG